MPKVYLLDYVAGNVRSLVNAIEKVGYTVEWIRTPEDVPKADVSVLRSQLDLNISSHLLQNAR
jgi:glutamine amidotransferase/cyclase